MQSKHLPFNFFPFPFPRTRFFFHVSSLFPKTPTGLNVGIKSCVVAAIPGVLGDAPEASLVSWDLH